VRGSPTIDSRCTNRDTIFYVAPSVARDLVRDPKKPFGGG
jgi:hypothetical protein